MEYNKLVRNNVGPSLQKQGFTVQGKILKGEQLQGELYSLFWDEFNKTLDADDKRLTVHYAEMLEVVKALIVINKANIKADVNKPLKWYKGFASKDKQLAGARTDLLQRYYELLSIKNKEVLKDQLNEVLEAYKDLVDAHNLDFAKIEQVRQEIWKKLGGYTKGVYIKTISKTATIQKGRSA